MGNKPESEERQGDANPTEGSFGQEGLTEGSFGQEGLTEGSFGQEGLTEGSFGQEGLTEGSFGQEGPTEGSFGQEGLMEVLSERQKDEIRNVTAIMRGFIRSFNRISERVFAEQHYGEKFLGNGETQWRITPTTLTRKYKDPDEGHKVTEIVSITDNNIKVEIEGVSERGTTYYEHTITLMMQLIDSNDPEDINDVGDYVYYCGSSEKKTKPVVSGTRGTSTNTHSGNGYPETITSDPGFRYGGIHTFLDSVKDMSNFLNMYAP